MSNAPARRPGLCARKALLWVAAALVALLGVELGLTLVAYGVDPLPGFFASSPDGTYELAAGTQTRYWHSGRIVTVTIGKDGLRTVPYTKDAATTTLHIVGDSQVFGWGLNDGETIPAQIQALLGSNAKVVNHGLPGLGPLAYLKIVARLPPDEPAIIILTEMNDFQDAYDVRPSLTHHCGFIVLADGFGTRLPCFLLRSQLTGLITDLRDRFFPGKIPLPLGFNPYARVSARVICRRIENNLIEFLNRRPGGSFIFTIPWEAQIEPDRLAAYAPSLAVAEAHTRLPGSAEILKQMKSVGIRKQIFLSNDHHLSPEGAETVARHIAETFRGQLGMKAQARAAMRCEDVL